jgi:AbrB family looped-hinge helix DNA binding protein
MAKTRNPLAVTVGDKGRLTLSEDVRRHLGINEGDVVLIELTENGTAEIVPAALVPRDQVWFAHPEMQARMREAHEDIAAGRTTRVTKRSELRAHLNRLKRKSRSD